MDWGKSKMQTLKDYAIDRDNVYPIYPPSDDSISFQEIEIQRSNWQIFLQSKNIEKELTEQWLWQYWREESRTSNPVKKKFFSMFSSRLQMQKKVKKLVRDGIPPELRCKIWYICAGGHEKKLQSPSDQQYSVLLSRLHELDGTIVGNEIERDLKRTFPSIPWIQSNEGNTSLRNILRSYALRCPKIGYCQSMNFISALLLIHMSEEKAFWTFASIIEDILPESYYETSMIGCRVDQYAFHACIAWKFPEIFEILKHSNCTLDPVICPWLLCCYVNVLPLHAACRVWDCMLWEGNITLFRVGLAMIQAKLPKLKVAADIMTIYTIFMKGGEDQDCSYLIESMNTEDFSAVILPAAAGTTGTGTGTGSNDRDSSGDEGTAGINSTTGIFGTRTVMSTVQRLMYMSYAKRGGIGSVPRLQLNQLRTKYRSMIENRDKLFTTMSYEEEIPVPPPSSRETSTKSIPTVPSTNANSTSSTQQQQGGGSSSGMSPVDVPAFITSTVDHWYGKYNTHADFPNAESYLDPRRSSFMIVQKALGSTIVQDLADISLEMREDLTCDINVHDKFTDSGSDDDDDGDVKGALDDDGDDVDDTAPHEWQG